MSITQVARGLYRSGLCVRPASAEQKRPYGNWKDYTEKRPDTFEEMWKGGLDDTDGIALICGAVSGGVICIDFDFRGYDFEEWLSYIPDEIRKKLYIELTQSNGVHVIYKCPDAKIRNQPLIRHYLPVEDGQSEVEFRGKLIKVDARGDAVVTTTETRAEGGLVIVAPSKWTDNTGLTREYKKSSPFGIDLWELRTLSIGEHEMLMDICARMSDVDIVARNKPRLDREAENEPKCEEDVRPSDFSRMYQFGLDALHKAGWTDLYTNRDGFLMMSRPGQTIAGDVGGAYNTKDDGFFCFTTNAYPFEGGRGYTSIEVYAELFHNGDVQAASEDIGSMMPCPGTYYEPCELTQAEIDMCNRITKSLEEKKKRNAPPPPDEGVSLVQESQNKGMLISFIRRRIEAQKPMEFPPELLKTDTILDKMSKYIDDLNMCHQPIASMAASFTFIGFMASRLFKLGFFGNETSPAVYTMLAAPTGTGKQAALDGLEKFVRIYADARLDDNLDAKYNYKTFLPASVQALHKKLELSPRCLMLADEFGQALQKLNAKNNNVNERAIIDALLPLSTNCFSFTYQPPTTVAEARANEIPTIKYPNLSIYATGNANDINNSFTEELLKKGFVNRLFLFYGYDQPEKKRWSKDNDLSMIPDLDWELTSYIENFAGFTTAHLDEDNNPIFVKMGYEDGADELIGAFSNNFNDAMYEVDLNELQIAALQRTIEKTVKAAMIYQLAMQQDLSGTIKISKKAARYAITLAMYQIANILFYSPRFGETGCTKLQNEIVEWLNSRGGYATKSEIANRFRRVSKKMRDETVQTLVEAGVLEESCTPVIGNRPKTFYKLKGKE